MINFIATLLCFLVIGVIIAIIVTKSAIDHLDKLHWQNFHIQLDRKTVQSQIEKLSPILRKDEDADEDADLLKVQGRTIKAQNEEIFLLRRQLQDRELISNTEFCKKAEDRIKNIDIMLNHIYLDVVSNIRNKDLLSLSNYSSKVYELKMEREILSSFIYDAD